MNLYCCIHSTLSNGNETQHYTYIAVITSFLLDFYTNNMYLVISYLYRKKPILDSLYIFFHVNSSKCMSYIISMCAAALVSSESKIHFSLCDEIAEINERKKIMIVLFIWFVCFLFVFFEGRQVFDQ